MKESNNALLRPLIKSVYLIGITEGGSKISVNCKNTDVDNTKKIIEELLSDEVTLVKTSFIPYKLFSWGYHKAAFGAHKVLNGGAS